MTVHSYIPNSDPAIKREMLDYIGIDTVEELFAVIPERIKLKKSLDVPLGLSEPDVKRKVETLLAKNSTCHDLLNFRGAGCWQHYVPAVCDEINSRSEFLTGYTGEPYSDLGRYQAIFEFQSMIADLVDMDAVLYPLYDWPTSAGDAVRMASLVTGRKELLIPRTISPERLKVIRNYTGESIRLSFINYGKNGQLDIEDLGRKISADTAAVYIENPTYLGFIETNADEISKISHNNGSLLVVGVEPLSLGVLTPPGEYGADIVCGECQPLGLHMGYGGVSLGFIACRDDARYLSSTGHRLITIAETEKAGELAFSYLLPHRSMFAERDKAASITGTTTVIWAITAVVYLSLLGPQGLAELSQVMMQKTNYAMKLLSEIDGVKAPLFDSPHFEEFTVNFDRTGKSVREINRSLLSRGIIGGKDISSEFPETGETGLFCFNELHRKEDIDLLKAEIEAIVA
jgi:glycine dehydrogenase subunit 1